jgi:hypothetical protein
MDIYEREIWRTWHVEEKSTEDQIAVLSTEHLEAFNELKAKWQKKDQKLCQFNDFMLLRFIRNSPGKHKFNVDSAWKVLKNYEKWAVSWGLLSLKISDVRAELETYSICLLPDTTRSRDGHQDVYMKPALHVPGVDPVEPLVKVLVYILERMTEREKTCTEGIAVIQNYAGYGWNNFSVPDIRSASAALQGKFPCRVRTFLVVNAPSFFQAAYKLMKPFITQDLQEKFKIPANTDELADLMAGDTHEARLASLPSEIGGALDIEETVQSFIKYRYMVEKLDYDESYPTREEIASKTKTIKVDDDEKDNEE